MKRFTFLFLLSIAVLVGMFSGGVEQRVTETPTVSTAAALSIDESWTIECPGGVAPKCVACNGVQCVSACFGDFICERYRNPRTQKVEACSYFQVCETTNPVPTFGWSISFLR